MRLQPYPLVTLALAVATGCYQSHEREVDAGPVLDCYPTARVLEYRGECVRFELSGSDEYSCEVPADITEPRIGWPPGGRAVAIVNATDTDARLRTRVVSAVGCRPGISCWGLWESAEGDPCSCRPSSFGGELAPTADYRGDSALPAGQIRTVLLANADARYEIEACPMPRE